MPIVPPEGKLDSRIALIGEALGAQELIQGRAFIGPSGRLLWHILGRYNIYRPMCYITNVIPDEQISDPLNKLSPVRLKYYIDNLYRELQKTSCNIYVPLGRTALYALTNEKSIDSWRGSIMRTVLGTKCIPTYHPAYILRRLNQLTYFDTDIERAVSQSTHKEIIVPQGQINTDPTIQDVINFTHEVLAKKTKLTYDIETDGTGGLTCIGLSIDQTRAIVIPLQGQMYWKPQELMIVIENLQQIFASNLFEKEAHNGSFDIVGLSLMGINVSPPYGDTMYKHHCYDPAAPPGIDQKSHSLATITSRYTLQPFYKSWDVTPTGKIGIPQLEGRSDLDRERGIREYCGIDVTTTRQISNILDNKMSKAQMNLYKKHHSRLQKYLITAYKEGINIDQTKSISLANTLRARAKAIELTLSNNFNYTFSVTSPKQLQTVLYDILNLPKQFHPDPRNPRKKLLTADDQALVQLYLKTQDSNILTIRDAKEFYKLASFLNPVGKSSIKKRRPFDGTLRTEYRPTTKTCRLASSFSTASRVGINLQNIPSYVRQVFVPKDQHIFIEADYRQAEAMIIAWDSMDSDMMHRFEMSRNDPEKYDIHWANAEIILERSRIALTKDDRSCCKHIVYGGAYLMQPPKTQETILKLATDSTRPYYIPGIEKPEYAPMFISLSECKRRLDKYISSVPKLTQWQENIAHIIRSTGKLQNSFGFTVTYHDIITDQELKYCFGFREKDFHDTHKEALAMIPQSSIAIMCCQAWMNVDDELRLSQIGRVVAQVHDSLLIEVKDDWPSIYHAYQVTKRHMEKSYVIKNNHLSVPIECKIGYSWRPEDEHTKIFNENDLWEKYHNLKNGRA
jgi:uracil-DNA glycosylase family 4